MPGVYISWPFCSQKCTYCNFASGIEKPEMQARYLHALCKELAAQHWPWTPRTLYFGGGTPSLMTAAELERIVSVVPGAPFDEFTLEAAPGSFDDSQVRDWHRLGVNRVSLGVQSFMEKELRQTGRRHTAETVAEDCERLRAAGISNINIDLISGLPFQTTESWEESLQWVARLAPPHVSVYMLEVDEDSRLGLEILGEGSRYGAGSVPQEDVIVSNYERAVAFLAEQGIPRYEISNFARPGFASKHNLKYWRMEPYLGFGVDAHSCEDGWRWGTKESPAEYVDCVESFRSPALDREAVRPVEERFLTGLRLDEGISVGTDGIPAAIRKQIDADVRDGLLEWHGERLRLSARGVIVSNEVFEQFLGVDSA